MEIHSITAYLLFFLPRRETIVSIETIDFDILALKAVKIAVSFNC